MEQRLVGGHVANSQGRRQLVSCTLGKIARGLPNHNR